MPVYDKKTKLIVNIPLDWTAINLSKEAKSLVFETDDEGNIKAQPVILIDPTGTKSEPVGATTPQAVMVVDGSYPTTRTKVNPFNIAGTLLGGSPVLDVSSIGLLANETTGNFESQRTPTKFLNITTLANGSTAIWTSGVGKKWRLMGICITLMQGTTAAGACALKMLDVAADTGVGVTLGIGALTAVPNTTIVLNASFGNGILAAATNTALNVNLSSVLAVGGVSVQVWGTEE